MHLPTIGTVKHVDNLKEHLDCEFRSLQEEGVYIMMSERARGPINFIELDLVEGGNTLAPSDLPEIVRGRVAQVLSDVIVDELEEPTIKRILRRDYVHFPSDEQGSVTDYVVRELRQGLDECITGDRATRKHGIMTALLEYLESHNEIVLEGFVRFRLKEYISRLENAVDHAVDEYLMEKEYGEFIRLLRYFVDTQEPSADVTHVIVGSDGKFWLADAEGKRIKNDSVDDLVIEMAEGDIEYEDVLMSNLITLAPRKVIVHKPPGVECTGTHLDTIKNVFGSRVEWCTGCDLCSANNANQNRV